MIDQIGQLLVVGLEKESVTFEETALIKKTYPGGFIHFKRNLKNPEQIIKLNRNLLELYENTIHSAPFISIDQEGGRVQRLPLDYYPYYPPANLIGKFNDSELTMQLAQAMADDLKQLGFNLNFAPVLDIHTNEKNPIIGNRSFGSTAQEVIIHGIQFMKGLQQSGIITCGKHFPGHGDTDKDSHLDLPIINSSEKNLLQRELQPFIEAGKQNLDSIMTAHIVIKELDQIPVTLSEKVLKPLLRKINFSGVVFSDDIEMKAVFDNYSIEQIIIMGLKAGINCFIIGEKKSIWEESYQCLINCYQDKQLKACIDKSINKIKNLKTKYPTPFQPSEITNIIQNDTIAALSRKLIAKLTG